MCSYLFIYLLFKVEHLHKHIVMNDCPRTAQLVNTMKIPDVRHQNVCVICHDEYKTFDKVCWASSSDRTHVFHEDCIVRWLTCLGWMSMKTLRRSENMNDEEKCLNYYLECPCAEGSLYAGISLSRSDKLLLKNNQLLLLV
jgi:hypothetical protein